jgi:hypothetical protein
MFFYRVEQGALGMSYGTKGPVSVKDFGTTAVNKYKREAASKTCPY